MQADTKAQRIALCEVLSTYGISISNEQAGLLLRHLELVIERNKVLNLTRITSIDEGIDKHIIDSLLLVKCFEDCSDKAFLDIGTGAGFPGIPISIASGMSGTLIDSVGKKVSAVNDFLTELDIHNVLAIKIRAEELAQEKSSVYDYVVARAVAETSVLLEYASPLLKTDGLAVIAKAVPTTDELEHATITAKICGMDYVSRETFELPHLMGTRTVLVYRKISEPNIKLPRTVGMAKHHPLYE